MRAEDEPRVAAGQRLARVLAGDPVAATSPTRAASPPDDPGSSPEPAGDPPATPAPGGLPRLAGAAFDPGRPGLRALAVVAVLMVIGAAGFAWWSRPRPEPVAPVLADTAAPSAVAPPASTEPAELVVAVSGEVREPGLVHLPPGSRVADAIEAAGGLLPGADIDHLNLARRVVDGELITVGIPPPPGPVEGGEPGSGGAAAPGGGLVNLNTATQAELETLPGIGPALARRIIDYRTQHGPFTSVGQLREVSGIGEARFAELEPLVTV
ncbi:MAG TPA: helix-hairpin-helix domain-containing protein [Natronosporangium sp.]